MENKAVAKTLRLLSQLMELHEENPFKVRSIANAAFKVDKLPFAIAKKSHEEMAQIDGLGKSTAGKIQELLQSGIITELNELLQKTPQGIVEMMQIKGIGPKKIHILWKTLGIENTGELYYACNENRLIEAKGFGLKTQEEIKKAIEFKMASSGRFLYAHIRQYAEQLFEQLTTIFNNTTLSFAGPYRRCCEIIDGLDLLIAVPLTDTVLTEIKGIAGITVKEKKESSILAENEDGFSIFFNFCASDDYGHQLLLKTGNEDHVNKLNELLAGKDFSGKSETELYEMAGLQYMEPELREGTNEFELAGKNNLPELIRFTDLKGSLHNHSTWSDGVHTIEEMAIFCRDKLNLSYFGICDHSKSAFYANGLNEIRIAAQQREIDELNKKLYPFKIFKGIESDILYDGSLDYPNEVLATFDFVVASVHSILKMNEEKATARLIKAIENTYTTILGHPTGRMLLTRSGYPIDFKKVIDACAANQVAIEINANPLRLDLDWRWHQYAIKKGVLLSVNPDAHRTEGLYDMRYGILAARKGGVSIYNCLNAMGIDEINHVFEQKRSSAFGKKNLKILIIRFSSIGDIILTTPVIRCIKQQLPGVTLHYLTKKAYESVLAGNPYIDKLHLHNLSLNASVELLKAENFDYIIDLHHNLRTLYVKRKIGVKSSSFNKLNLQKWLMVNFRINHLPKMHIADRYLQTAAFLGVVNDDRGLDYFLKQDYDLTALLPASHQQFVGLVIGARHVTKRLPVYKLAEICLSVNQPIVLLGGPEDRFRGGEIAQYAGKRVFNGCGMFTIDQSAFLVKHATKIITHDTGLMHIAAAFNKPVASVWGNTIPEFGMYPYKTDHSLIIEVSGLSCRPCSKIGYKKCPRGHFKCMNNINISAIINFATK